MLTAPIDIFWYMPSPRADRQIGCSLSERTPPGMQVVRSRIQQRQDVYRGVRYESSWRSVQVILRREGMRGLYKGLVPNVLRVMPQSAITFLVYEKAMQLLEKHLQSGTDLQ